MKLNCDLGEAFGNWRMGDDETIMPLIHQANIACGFHAGDPMTMRTTLALAKRYGVSVGAHPAYPDLQGFGRRTMACSADEIRAIIQYQMAALEGLAQMHAIPLSYVKPHGALYNDMMANDKLLHTVMSSVSEYRSGIALMLLATSHADKHRKMAEQYQLPLLFEGFADRLYQDDGSLTPRSQSGAVLNPEQSLAQAELIIRHSEVNTASGNRLCLPIDSLCVHGDSPHAVTLTEQIHAILQTLD